LIVTNRSRLAAFVLFWAQPVVQHAMDCATKFEAELMQSIWQTSLYALNVPDISLEAEWPSLLNARLVAVLFT
jgi:hypothetical protein